MFTRQSCFRKKLREVETDMRRLEQTPNPVAAHARTMLCCISNQRAGKCPFMDENGKFDATRAAVTVCPVKCPLAVDGRGDAWESAVNGVKVISLKGAGFAPAAEAVWPWSGKEKESSVG